MRDEASEAAEGTGRMRRGASKKALAQRRHAKRRANERFGLTLNRHELQALTSAIRAGRFAFVERQSNRVTVWAGIVKGQSVCVVYDSKQHQVVTFLPTCDDRHVEAVEMASEKPWVKEAL